MPLDSAQRKHLMTRLHEERARVVKELDRYTTDLDGTNQDAAGDLSKVPFHPADEGTDSFERELDAQEATRLSNELGDIDEALDRMSRTPEAYGTDEATGEEIPFERLDIIPWAKATVDRAARQEPAA